MAGLVGCLDSLQAFFEDFQWGQEADDEERFGFEIEEVAGLYEGVVLIEKMESPFFFGADVGDAEGRIPAAFDVQDVERGIRQRGSEGGEIFARAALDLGCDRRRNQL